MELFTGKKRKRKEKDETDLLFENFTSKTLLQKKQIKENKRRKTNMEKFKKYANNCFNSQPTTEEIQLWSNHVISQEPSLEMLQKKYNQLSATDIPIQNKKHNTDLEIIMHFLSAAAQCITILDNHFKSIGWNANVTGYDPIASSRTVDELKDATIECIKMAIKQKILYIQNK